MSKKLPSGITRSFLEQVTLPNHGGRYTPISHKAIIDNSLETIVSKGLNVAHELYASNASGTVANGKILLTDGSDDILKMMFIWGNSYDKSTRFKCGVGAYIERTGCYLFAGNLSNFSRKHTGTADKEAMDMIESQLGQANMYYKLLCETKNEMIKRTLSVREMSQILGVLFVEKELLNKEQMSVAKDKVKQEIAMFEEYPYNNMWNFYNIIAFALKDGHPKTWFEDQAGVHAYFSTILSNSAVVTETAQLVETEQVPSNQLSLLDAIEEVENTTKEDDIFSIFDDNSPLELPEL